MCAGICQLVTSWSLTGLVARLVRELGEALGDSGGTGEEGAGAGTGDAAQRHCAQFLTELTQLMPSHMIPAAQAMRSYLENDEVIMIVIFDVQIILYLSLFMFYFSAIL